MRYYQKVQFIRKYGCAHYLYNGTLGTFVAGCCAMTVTMQGCFWQVLGTPFVIQCQHFPNQPSFCRVNVSIFKYTIFMNEDLKKKMIKVVNMVK